MVDLNVLLDVVQRREPFYAASAAVLSRVIEGPDLACLPSHALTTLHYIVGAGQIFGMVGGHEARVRARLSQKSWKRPLRMVVRRAMMALAPRTVQ
ncbi:MAG TPA: hypothetical protein VHQ90_02980, partial [Thermoanaerobaculia bacterium]|nr:hypothetical protein [Thermoanaerobaculia bacterium]